LFTPPSLRGSVYLPYLGGGANWGSIAYDPRSHFAIVNATNISGYVRLFPAADFDRLRQARPLIGGWATSEASGGSAATLLGSKRRWGSHGRAT